MSLAFFLCARWCTAPPDPDGFSFGHDAGMTPRADLGT